MQFMEPLGVTDSSVEAAWDHQREPGGATSSRPPANWRRPCCGGAASSPTSIVGARASARGTNVGRCINLMWDGIESNQIGTAEFVDFSRQVHAEPLMCVNFESDGRRSIRDVKGENRSGDAKEAADWVAYCNDPDNAERRSHGFADPLPIRYWQLGNETSYDNHGFDRATPIAKTIEFAKAMRASIRH